MDHGLGRVRSAHRGKLAYPAPDRSGSYRLARIRRKGKRHPRDGIKLQMPRFPQKISAQKERAAFQRPFPS